MSPLPETELVPPAGEERLLKSLALPSGKGWGRWAFVGIGVFLGLGIALIGSRLGGGTEPSPADTADRAPASGSTQAVTVIPAQMGTVVETLTVTGTVEAGDLLTVTPQVPGLQVRQVLVAAGDTVAAGQPLVILDDADLRAQLQQAQAQIEVARAQVQQQRASLAQAEASRREAQSALERFQSLANEGAISPLELDNRSTQAVTAAESVRVAQATVASAEATVRSREADITRLQTQLAYTVVRAPAAGTVAEPPASVGDVSATSAPMVSLIRDNQLELIAAVPQAQLSQVAVGAPVTVSSSTDSQLQVSGVVQDIRPLVDAATRTAKVVIRLPASDRLRVGMFLSAEIQVGSRTGLTVPSTALLPQGDGTVQVLVVDAEGRAQSRTVETGPRLTASNGEAAPVEILSGLTAGEQVIVSGGGYVQDGDGVTVVEDLQ